MGKIIHVRIDEASDLLLTKKAEETGLTRSAHVQLALNEYLRPVDVKSPRRPIGPKK